MLSCRVQAFVFVLVLAVDFNREVRPILSDRCYPCHGPDSANRKTPMRLDEEASAKSQLKSKRFAVVAGKPDESEIYRRIVSDSPALRMPPAYNGHPKLDDKSIAIVKKWIEEGARYRSHWAFVPPVREPKTTIDSIVRAKLAKEGLTPSPEASQRTLLRRVTFDLTGLPPTPEEIEAFVSGRETYGQVVDRLLASPRYAERMAIRWLEAARYADTNGYQTDGVRDMYRYRDWVIEAFQKNMPFDQFTIEQIAGDMLPNATLSQKIASAFHRNHRTTAEGGIVDEEWRVEYVADRAETTSTVFLGLTIGCARCHDHKYDPLKQKEFYSLYAFFNNVPEKGFVYNFGNERPLIKAPTPPQEVEWRNKQVARDSARDAWKAAQPAVAKEQAKWEKRVAKQNLDWVAHEGLVFDAQLFGDTRFDGTRVVKYDEKTAKFNHREPYTMSVWVKPETREDSAILTRTEDYMEGTGYGLYMIGGKFRFHYNFRWTDLGMRLETKQDLKPGEWQQIAVTYDGGMYTEGVHLYINGQEVEKNVLFNSNLWPMDHKAPLRLGQGAGLSFKGEIKRPQIWARELSPDEVAAIALEDDLSSVARKKSRTKAEQAKLDLAFRERFLPAHLAAVKRQWREAEDALEKFEKTLPTVMVMQEGPPRDTHVLVRGAYDRPGDKVGPLTPAALHAWKPEWPRNRLGLAQWLVSRDNPLTARVTVNRYWQMLFGTGLVKTVEDFGSQGEQPPQQELLDWLAVEFMDSGWNVQKLLKTIVTSATYRQASQVPAQDRDPENRLLARGPRIRLSPEMIRDQALAASGLLVERVGGPSVKPYQPPGLWQELAGGDGYKPDKGEGLYRRSLYTYWRRTIAPPGMVNFDSPNRETCIVRETRTNTPLQALNLMNDETYLEAARKLAERVLREDQQQPLRRAFLLVTGREPSSRETQILEQSLAKFKARFDRDPAGAQKYLAIGDSRSVTTTPAELAAWTSIASMILNLDEAVTKQ
jgi:hypothetical protein